MKKIRRNREGVHLDRRTFLKGAALGLAATALPLNKADASFWDSFFQKHFHEMNDGEIKQVLARLEREYEQQYKKKITVGNEQALPGVLFGYGLDLSRCIGCRRCVYACVEENNQSKDPQIHWIGVLRFKKGEKWVDLEESEKYYNPELVPEKDYFYMPVQCRIKRHAENRRVVGRDGDAGGVLGHNSRGHRHGRWRVPGGATRRRHDGVQDHADGRRPRPWRQSCDVATGNRCVAIRDAGVDHARRLRRPVWRCRQRPRWAPRSNPQRGIGLAADLARSRCLRVSDLPASHAVKRSE